MIKTLREACSPRQSVFDRAIRDTVDSIDDLPSIDPNQFFAENHVTEGMRQLLTEAFQRLEGKSQSSAGVFLLSQSMGGGKTHNLIALGLLAKYPSLRQPVMRDFHTPGPLGAVRVVPFSGRNTNTPFGIWMEIAKTLGRQEVFKAFYEPLMAPSESAWVELLQGEPVLLLLDELPPYFQAMRARQVGGTTLDVLTTTALANLFAAVVGGKLPNVCVVLTDLRASAYSEGSAALSTAVNAALQNLEGEANRTAVRIDPVRLNSDELYHILRTRLFAHAGDAAEADEVAAAYGKAVAEANAMGITLATEAQERARVRGAYPFHPGMQDLFARFKENPRFQQTRALIRIMRAVVAKLWDSGEAGRRYLIGAHDIDLLDAEMMSEVRQINGTLEAAIAHDIAREDGTAVAQRIDSASGSGADARDAATLIFLSSLSQAVNPTIGLTRSDIAAYLADPGRSVAQLRHAIDRLQAEAWYLHATSAGALLFRPNENLNAKLESYAQGMLEVREIELRTRLKEMFEPKTRACYGSVEALPALDQVQLNAEQTTLVIFRPSSHAHQEIAHFYEHMQFRNRVLFLTGDSATYERVLERSAYLRAIGQIIAELQRGGMRETDPQMVEAKELQTREHASFYLACREAFRQLLYPTKNGLNDLPLEPQYAANSFNGEQMIVAALQEAYKYEPDATVNNASFVDRVVNRLWSGAKEMPWNEVKQRAATDPAWIWHHPRALDDLRTALIQRDQWREVGSGFVQRGPFPPPPPSVQVQVLERDDKTGEATLRVKPLHGDAVYMQAMGVEGSARVKLEEYDFKTRAVRLTFIAENTQTGATGEPVVWTNTVAVNYRFFDANDGRRCELQAIPSGTIRYTTDGAGPANSGVVYGAPFVVPVGCTLILAQGAAEGVTSELLRVQVPRHTREKGGGFGEDWQVDPAKPATWRKRRSLDSTGEVFAFLSRATRHEALLAGARLVAARDQRFAELQLDAETQLGGDALRELAERLQSLVASANLTLEVTALALPDGRRLLDLAADLKETLSQSEVTQ